MGKCIINNDIDIDLIYSETIEENIISINSKKELFFDVYQCVVNDKKLILEKIGESDLGPKVLLEVNIDGKRYSAEAILVDNGSNYVELNKENIYFIRSVPTENKSPSEIMQDELEPIINEDEISDKTEVNYENIIEHHVNNKLVFLHELEEQFEEKVVSLKDDISKKLDLFFEKLEDKKKVIIDEKLNQISDELNEKIITLQSELHGVEDFSKKNIDNILENKINEIDNSVNLFLEGITKEYKNKIISSDKKITHNFLELNSIKDKLKESNNNTNKKFEELNLLKEKLLIQDELVLKNKELKKFINEEFLNIDNKLKSLSIEENKKYNDLLAAVNNKDIVEYKTILKEKIQDVELTQIKESLQEEISDSLRGDIVSLKRYVEMSSSGGSNAKQFALGGTMDGNLNVTGELKADTILATTLLSATTMDINFELSGFNVTGDLSASGGLSANNINVSGDILPSQTTSFNIGSSALRFNDIFLAGSTIDLSGTKISTDSDGDIEFRDSNNLTKRIKASELILESANDPDNDIVFKVDASGNPEFQKRRRSNPNIIEPSTTISDIVSAVQVRVRGNVGIGTSPERPPNNPLTVVGNISATDTVASLSGHFADAVGIGTTSPDAKLDISSSSFAGKYARFSRGTTNIDFDIDAGGTCMKSTVKTFHIGTCDSQPLRLLTNNSTRVCITETGNVGIGATTPGEKLVVNGNITTTGDLSAANIKGSKIISSGDVELGGNIVDTDANEIMTIDANDIKFTGKHIRSGFDVGVRSQRGCVKGIAQSNSSSSKFGIFNCSIEAITVDTVGKVGIGNTSPNNQLTVSGNISATDSLFISNSATINGLVGIGTTSPNEILHVEDSSSSNGTSLTIQNAFGESPKNIKFRYSDAVETARIEGYGRNNISQLPYLAFHVNQTTDSTQSNTVAERMRITSTGNVGIGKTDPDKLLVVEGANAEIVINDTNSTPLLRLRENGITKSTISTINENLVFTAGGSTERMRIKSDGRVGIGTTSPQGKLDVATSTQSDIFNLRIHNINGENAQSTGILFNTGYTDVTRGKGGLVYEYDTTLGWNRGDFHFLQRNNTGSSIAQLSDSVLTIKNNGNIGIGTTSPNNELTVSGSISSTSGYKIGENALVTHDTSYTLSLSDNGKTTFLNTSNGAITITVPPLEPGFTNRFIKDTGIAPVVFATGNGLSALGSYQDRNEMSVIYSQADIIFKSSEYAFLGGNLE